jgi:TonB family protein
MVNDSTERELVGKPPITTVDSIQPVKADEKVLDGVVEESAHFRGGETALQEYLKANIRYPDGECVQGRVVVSFNIGKDGTISNAKVEKSLSPAYDKEALRLVNAMPKWHPGKQLGQAVDTKYVLPIIFNHHTQP